jgi:hypothetical protein
VPIVLGIGHRTTQCGFARLREPHAAMAAYGLALAVTIAPVRGNDQSSDLA